MSGARAVCTLGLGLFLFAGGGCDKERAPATPERDSKQAPGRAPTSDDGPGTVTETPSSPTGGAGKKDEAEKGEVDREEAPTTLKKPSAEPAVKGKKTADALRRLDTLEAAVAEFARAKSALKQAYSSGAGSAVELSGGDTRCKSACAAFASLERSAEAICRLAGSSDGRCGSAKRIVELNRKKLSACRCEE